MSAMQPGDRPRSPGHDPTLVGAYVLGTLDPVERAAVKRHLSECSECQNEFQELADLPGLLDRVDLADLETGPAAGEDLFARVAAAVEEDRFGQRRRHRMRLAFTGAAAAVVAAGGSIAGVALTGGGAASQVFAASSGRVHMSVTVSPGDTGSALAVNVAGLPDDEHCRLIAVSTSGARQMAGSWTASYSGTARLSGLATSFRPAQLSELVLQLTNSHRQLVVHT